MSGFDDVISQALPFLAVEHIQGVQGATWQWEYLVTDSADANVNMTSGYTGDCSLRSTAGGSEGVAPTVTFPSSGVIRCKVLPATSAAVAPGTYLHELTITRTSDGAKVVAVGGGVSRFAVLPKVDP